LATSGSNHAEQLISDKKVGIELARAQILQGAMFLTIMYGLRIRCGWHESWHSNKCAMRLVRQLGRRKQAGAVGAELALESIGMNKAIAWLG